MILATRTNSLRKLSLATLAVLIAALISASTWAVVPSDTLMSVNTRGFASVADIQTLHQHWQQTQLGQLVRDEAMQPFIDDLKQQLQRKIAGVRDKLGLELSDLKEVAAGEIGIGMVERPNELAAVVLTVDVTGRNAKLEALLGKIHDELTKRNATRTNADVSGTTVTTYAIPPQAEDDIERSAVFFVKDNMFCASDSRLEAEEVLRRFDGQSGDRLADLPAYQETMSRCAKEAAGLQPEVSWFVDPFGYARAIRTLAVGEPKKHGKDYAKILSSQGFDAIQGIGGFVNLAVGSSYELLHRTAVFAPPITGEPEKYRQAMRMMRFPNQENLAAYQWLPRKLASYRTFNCDLAHAFKYFGTLFDAFVGYETFDVMIEGLEKDPYGPHVNIANDFVAHLGQRVTMVTDYKVPITPKSERFLFVIELKNETEIAKTVVKLMQNDPNASRTEFDGKVIWEIQEKQEDAIELDIAIDDLDLLEPLEDEKPIVKGGNAPNKVQKGIPTSAVCVTDSHLFIASHAAFLREIFTTESPDDALSTAGDYREVDAALSRLVEGPVAARCFLRTDETYRPAYELLRQGRMPESETLMGRILNRLLTPDDEEDGILREQKIDGRKLPDFEMVRRYFGPAGTIIRSEDDGWLIVGATLSKLPAQANAENRISAERSTVR